MTLLTIIFLSFIMLINSQAQSNEPDVTYGAFIDSRDNRTYKTVQIGSQVWMAENLAFLPSVSPPSVGSDSISFYYVYNYHDTIVSVAKDTANYHKYGVLYNWPAAVNACPEGWHIPSDAEWTTLVNCLIANGYNYDESTSGNKIAKSLAISSEWAPSTNQGAIGNSDYPSKINLSGFSALPAGYRHDNKSFRSAGSFTAWWSVSLTSSKGDWCRTLNFYSPEIIRGGILKSAGFSVRCVKDE